MAVSKTDNWKVKKWYNIIAPKMFGEINIGETLADNPEKLIGRNIEITFGELTNDISKHNTKLILKIDNIGGDSAYTKYVGHQLNHDYLCSLVKRETSSIETNVLVTTMDNYTIRVKPSSFTIKKARENQIKAIRQIMINVIDEKAKKMNMEQFIQDVVAGKLSTDIYYDVRSIYPLRRVEIRRTQIETEPMK